MYLAADRPTGLFGWVRSNNARSTAYFLGFAVAAQVIIGTILAVPLALFDEAHSPLYGPLGYIIRYVPIFFVLTLLLFGAQLWVYTQSVQRNSGFRFVNGEDEPRLCKIIENLLITMGLPAPFVAVIDSAATNAFACGVSRHKAVVVVTRGLLDHLNDAELEAVLAHELVHIKNGDIRLMAAANVCVSNLTKMHKWNPLHFRNAIHAVICFGFPVFFVLMFIGGLIGQLAIRGAYGSRLVISGSREYIADAEAVQITKNPAALASALFRVQKLYRIGQNGDGSDAMMIAGDSVGPTATHPDVKERVDALAQTTGSMVFNAPDANEEAKSNRFQRKAAGGLSDEKMSVFQRVGSVTGEDIFGFTKTAGWTFILALCLSMIWQGKDLLNPNEMIARMDVRPFGKVLGSNDIKCLIEGRDMSCRDDETTKLTYYVEQDGTLLGYLAQRLVSDLAEKAKRLEGLKRDNHVVMKDYYGRSGKLTGVQLMTAQNGEFLIDDKNYPFLRSSPPGSATLAELKQIGCFHEHFAHGENIVAESIRYGDGVDVSKYGHSVNMNAHIAITNGDKELLEYARIRRIETHVAFDYHGLEGLKKIRGILSSDLHRQVEARLAERIGDPGFLKGKSVAERAHLVALATKPDRYIPCLALPHLGM